MGKRSRLYEIWAAMKQRCLNKQNRVYYRYGGRGINVCDEWKKDFKSFEAWSLANGYEENLTLDRINNNGNYEPSNCRWTTYIEQANNTRRNHLVTIDGVTKTLTEWARYLDLNRSMLESRIYRGWNTVDAILTPVAEYKTITVNDCTHTIAEWAEKVGVPRDAIKQRLRQGWDTERAILVPYRNKEKIIIINNVSKNIKEWSEYYKINKSTVQNRIKNGWDPIVALTTPANKRGERFK